MSCSDNSIFFRVCSRFVMAVAPFCLLLAFPCCEPETRPARATDHIRTMDEKLISYNRQAVRSEKDEILDYISRHQWKMLRTSTGLYYMIYEQGRGNKILKGRQARI